MAEVSAPTAKRDVDRLFHNIGQQRSIIKVLRFVVPFSGALMFAYLVLPMIVSAFFPAAQFDAVRISSDRLVIDAPRAKGPLGDGGRYSISAHSAETGLADQNTVSLVDMIGDLFFADGTTAKVTSDDGRYSFPNETLEMLTAIDISSSTGDKGSVGSGVVHLSEQRFTGADGVLFEFIDGSTLDADTMKYDAIRREWEFTNFKLVLTPKDTAQ